MDEKRRELNEIFFTDILLMLNDYKINFFHKKLFYYFIL